MWRRRLACVGWVAVAASGVACNSCPDADLRATRTFSARVEGLSGADALAGESTYIDGMRPDFAEVLILERTVADASSAPSAWLALGLESASAMSLRLVVPLPLASGQSLSVVTTPGLGTGIGIIIETDRTTSWYPHDAVAAFLWTPAGPDCTRQTPEICAAQQDALDRQVVTGTVLVSSIKPLRLQLDIAVTYPPESGFAPKSVNGEVIFSVSQGRYCTPRES